MAIFNKKYTLSLLNEMKNKEEYRRNSFKKKYKFEPDEENKNIGKIKVDGKEYKINMDKTKNVYVPGQGNKERVTAAFIGDDKYGTITLDKKFFKLKGSNHNERRDAALQHEIGHHKNETDGYMNSEQKSELDKAKSMANKYSKTDIDKHIDKNEFLADKYAANKISKSAIKKAVRNAYDIKRKETNREINKVYPQLDKERIKKLKRDKRKDRTVFQTDMNQRSKALNDYELSKQYNKYIK